MDESGFDTVCGQTLSRFWEILDEAIGDLADVDLESGILTVKLDAGGHYVINRHGPLKQIWMSSPISGATHFEHDPTTGGWTGTRGEGNLAEILADEVRRETGVAVSL